MSVILVFGCIVYSWESEVIQNGTRMLFICCIRMDTTLVDFSEMKWERGDITFLFIGERKHSLVILDNKFKVYQYIRYQVTSFSLPAIFWNYRNIKMRRNMCLCIRPASVVTDGVYEMITCGCTVFCAILPSEGEWANSI
jgi:hypothetical protein